MNIQDILEENINLSHISQSDIENVKKIYEDAFIMFPLYTKELDDSLLEEIIDIRIEKENNGECELYMTEEEISEYDKRNGISYILLGMN